VKSSDWDSRKTPLPQPRQGMAKSYAQGREYFLNGEGGF